jgi:hypothetical protein
VLGLGNLPHGSLRGCQPFAHRSGIDRKSSALPRRVQHRRQHIDGVEQQIDAAVLNMYPSAAHAIQPNIHGVGEFGDIHQPERTGRTLNPMRPAEYVV